MQKTSKTEALTALAQALRKANGVIMHDNPADIVREFIESSPDTGEAVAWRARGNKGRWVYMASPDIAEAYPDAEPLFTHPVTPEGGEEWTDEEISKLGPWQRIMDKDGLDRYRETAKSMPGHDMAPVNGNSLFRLVGLIDALMAIKAPPQPDLSASGGV